MSVDFTYMGTKRRIADQVARVIANASPGPLLDLFAGMSSVGLAVMPQRQLWCNDVQHFAHTVATATFTSKLGPNLNLTLLCSIVDLSNLNQAKLKFEFARSLLQEDEIVSFGGVRRCRQFNEQLIQFCGSAKYRRRREALRLSRTRWPYCLFSITYAGGYIGLRQAIELDSLRFAIDELRRRRQVSAEQCRWMLLALCKALLSTANTTGHFAQYLSIKNDTLGRFLAKRRRSVFREWLAAMADLSPAGAAQWRQDNRTFRKDASVLLQQMPSFADRPTVIYADPPYTADHYSRYYHLWETLLRYDYPEPTGKGQYRPDRFVSKFSIRSKVEQQFEHLIARAAELGVELVVNYPENGLLDDPRNKLLSMLRKRFAHAEIAMEIPHEHSTLGASNGIEKEKVTELVFYAR